MTDKKKLKIMSLSVEPEMHDQMKAAARKLGHNNVSQLIRDLVSKYIDLMVNDSGDIPVILRIPPEIQEQPEQLREWLDVKVRAIAQALA